MGREQPATTMAFPLASLWEILSKLGNTQQLSHGILAPETLELKVVYLIPHGNPTAEAGFTQ